MLGLDATNPNNTDGKLGFSYSLVSPYAITECVLDNATGLMWEGKPATGSRAGGLTYTNFGDNRVGDASAYVASINAAGLCGFKDWRLPSADELQSLVDYSIPWGGPAIDATWFPNTPGWPAPALAFWSSTSFLGDANQAWMVNFVDGGVGFSARTNSNQVRVVRAGN